MLLRLARTFCSGLALALALTATPARAAERVPVVYAASSLTDVLAALSKQWSAMGHPAPVLQLDASSRLAVQIANGAPADLFLSADEEWIAYVAQRGRIDDASRVELAGNSLVVVTKSGERGPSIEALLVTSKRIALAGENVPAGRYAREALKTLGIWDRMSGKIVNGQNVRQALEYVARGEADAGIVFRTDVLADARVKQAFEVPPSAHPRIVYVGAIVKRGEARDEAASFLAFLHSDAAAPAWREAGFLPAGERK